MEKVSRQRVSIYRRSRRNRTHLQRSRLSQRQSSLGAWRRLGGPCGGCGVHPKLLGRRHRTPREGQLLTKIVHQSPAATAASKGKSSPSVAPQPPCYF